ncbi:hypothetical protein MKW98_022263, partial [Papaver atlanticum]
SLLVFVSVVIIPPHFRLNTVGSYDIIYGHTQSLRTVLKIIDFMDLRMWDTTAPDPQRFL